MKTSHGAISFDMWDLADEALEGPDNAHEAYFKNAKVLLTNQTSNDNDDDDG